MALVANFIKRESTGTIDGDMIAYESDFYTLNTTNYYHSSLLVDTKNGGVNEVRGGGAGGISAVATLNGVSYGTGYASGNQRSFVSANSDCEIYNPTTGAKVADVTAGTSYGTSDMSTWGNPFIIKFV